VARARQERLSGPAPVPGRNALGAQLAADPAVEHVVAGPGRDQRIARTRAWVPDDVVEPLGVDDQLHGRVQRDAGLGRRVILVLAQDEHRLAGLVVQLEPGPDDPALAVRVEPVVVVQVHLAQGRRLVAGVELDDPDPAVAGANFLDVPGEARRDFPVFGPQPIPVRLAVIPETAAVHLARRRGQRRKVRVAPALPVHVLERFPLGWRNGLSRPVAHNYVALVSQDTELAMHAFPLVRT